MEGVFNQFIVTSGANGAYIGRIVLTNPFYAVYHDGEKEVWRRVKTVDEGYDLIVNRMPAQCRNSCFKHRLNL